ncbi:glycosyltransferase 61 family protein [Neoroseomonas lacus]|uniref:glycosyltransferase 61 family protein n=1 Tax=Neoroseomonas lacus TaxID=287609 RepID=UPI00166F2485|nr:glycosyltransferase family 61 protein [Neoroseomonas lacus]
MTIAPLPDAGPEPMQRLIVVPAHQSGSVQHFYHFLFGYLLPFIEHCHALRGTHRFLLRDCGPMNGLLRELDGFAINIVAANLVLNSLVGLNSAVGNLPKIILPGFDSPATYARPRFLQIRRIVQDLYGPRIAAAAARHPLAASERFVLVIDRAPPHPFYNTAASENRSAGAARRSVPNMAEIHAAIAARHDAALIRLEDCSLFEQIHLFSRAWRVVGQHGAGLAHMLWAPSGGGLVEILPNPGRRPVQAVPNGTYFRNLCNALGLAWHVVPQADAHGRVAPEEILAAIA